MAYTAGNLTLMATGNGFNHYRYDTTDTAVTVDADGYFNNSDDSLNLAVGDIIDIVVWGTAVRTGTISDYDKVIVNSVSAAGVVDCTNILHAITVGDTR
jgi:hypothetical protein